MVPYRTGSALSEYGFILALIAVAGLVALTLLGGNTSQLINRSADNNMLLTHANTLLGDQPAEGNTGSTDDPNWAPGMDHVIRLADGREINLINYPADIREAITTAGTNGTTEQILAALERLIPQLREMDAITEEEANILRQLAQQGHRLADRERYIEDALANSATEEEFVAAMVRHSGPGDGNYSSAFMRQQYQEVRRVVELQISVRSRLWQRDPALGRLVDIISHDIAALGQSQANAVASFGSPIVMDDYNMTAIMQDLQAQYQNSLNANGLTGRSLRDLAVSSITHQGSNTICNGLVRDGRCTR